MRSDFSRKTRDRKLAYVLILTARASRAGEFMTAALGFLIWPRRYHDLA